MPDVQPALLEDLVRLVTNKTLLGKDPTLPYVGLEHLESGSPDLRGHAMAVDSISTNSIFETGDTLFGKLRPNLRKVVTAPFDGYCSTDILVLRAEPESTQRFITRLMQSEAVVSQAIRTAIGTKMPRTSWHALRKLPVHAPPAIEQSLIAAILDDLDETLRRTEKFAEKLKLVKQGLLRDLLTLGIDDDGELRDPIRHPEQFKDSPLGLIPARWSVQRVDTLLAPVTPAMRSGPFGSALLKSELVEDGVPLLGIDNVHEERFSAVYERFVTPAKAIELTRYRVRPSDVLITIMGTVGRCCVAPSNIGNAISTKHVWAITLNQARYSPALACMQINHAPWVKRQFMRDSQGGIMSAISSNTLKSLLLPVPSQIEANEIEKILVTLHSRLVAEVENAAKLRLLKQALMDDLLTGRVRVTPLLEQGSTP